MEGDFQEFMARVERLSGMLLLRLPQEISQALPSRGNVMAEGEVNGQAFIAPLEPDGRGGHWLSLENDLALSLPGSMVSLRLRPASVWVEPVLPENLGEALMREGLLDAWTACTVKARWEWIRWIRATGNPLTRQKRVEVACDKLRKGDRRPCCFNTSACTVPQVCKSGILMEPGSL